MSKRTKTGAAAAAESGVGDASGWAWLRRPGVLCLLLALATLAVFLPVAWHGFVNYDDADYVTENAQVQGGLKWASIVWAFTTGHASNWHPLTWISHMADCQLFGLQAGGHHLVSVGLHIANALLLFGLLRRMTGALWRSALVAALFALHPLHVESVAWASERKDVLSTLFFLLTLWAYAAYAEGRRPEARPGRARRPAANYLLALGCFALGLMSKPMLVTLPFVLLLLDYWPLQRWPRRAPATQPDTATGRPRPGLFSLLLEKAPFFALAAASSIVTYFVQRHGGAVSTSLTFGERVANALISYARYIGKTFWPLDLSILYPHPGRWPLGAVAGAAVLLLAISVVVALRARKQPYLAVGWLWFCGTLVPVIGLVQVGIQSMADRYTYVPLIGGFIMLVWGVDALVPARPGRGKALALGAGLGLAACALLAARQVRFWRNSEELFGHAVRVTRDNYLAHNNLGYYLNGQGRTAEAVEHYRRALQIKPTYEDALNNLGYALAAQRQFAEAISLYEAALRSRPKHIEVHNNLGNALSEVGRIDEAIQHYSFVLQQKPGHADAHNNLGIALAMQGKLDEAIPHFHEAIRAKTNYASAHSNLGNALAAQHKLDEAIQEYQIALRLKPQDPQAHNNLGNVLAEQGKIPEAIAQYREALRLRADNPEAHFNLALGLLRQGHREEAAEHLRAALRLRPDYPDARRHLEALAPADQN